MNGKTIGEPFQDLRTTQDLIPQAAMWRGWRSGQGHHGSSSGDATLDDGLLTIQGERHTAHGAVGEKVHRSERGYGVFRLSVTLPSSHVRADKTEAWALDGVLEILAPKGPGVQAGRIQVRIGPGHAAPVPERNGPQQ